MATEAMWVLLILTAFLGGLFLLIFQDWFNPYITKSNPFVPNKTGG